METKYIIFKSLLDGEFPVLFPTTIQHDKMTTAFKPVAAGFCDKNTEGHYDCYGNSSTLKLKSRSEDADILDSCFNRDY